MRSEKLHQEIQVKLLRVIQEHEFERVGGLRTIKVDVRIITATNQKFIAGGALRKFSRGFIYRLNVLPIVVPPLREKKENMRQLADLFADKFNKKLDLAITIDSEVKEMLLHYECRD